MSETYTFIMNAPIDIAADEPEIRVTYECYPRERRTWDSPGYPPAFGVLDVVGVSRALTSEEMRALVAEPTVSRLEEEARTEYERREREARREHEDRVCRECMERRPKTATAACIFRSHQETVSA